MNNKVAEILTSVRDLDSLEDLYDDLSIDGPTPDQLYCLYGVFLNEIVKNPILIKGVELQFNRDKSKHPVCKNKMKAFEHIITRESKYKGKRDFDPERANKIHWIKPVIENANSPRVLYFERINDEGYNQQFYWYEEKNFMVIVREKTPNLFLITCFKTDIDEKLKFRGWYNEFNSK